MNHVLFSYHGVQRDMWNKISRWNSAQGSSLRSRDKQRNKMCYKATCYATTSHLSKMLNLSEDKFTNTFQSRLGRDPWLEPYTDQTVEHLAKKGVKKC